MLILFCFVCSAQQDRQIIFMSITLISPIYRPQNMTGVGSKTNSNLFTKYVSLLIELFIKGIFFVILPACLSLVIIVYMLHVITFRHTIFGTVYGF